MTTIISPITSMITIIVLMTILVIVLFRIHRGKFSETTTLLQLTFLLILATDAFALLYLLTFYFVYMPYYLGTVVSMLGSAFVAALCLGVAAPIDKKRAQDDVWNRWLKERNSWEEARRKSALETDVEPH